MATPRKKFVASFDGDGKTITGLTINQPTMDHVGLFGFATGIIQNLGVINVDVTGKKWVGGVVGYSHSQSAITNCYVTGTVTGGDMLVGGVVGGVVGSSRGAVSNCYSTATVTGNSDYVGGVVGDASNVTNCYATGAVLGKNYVGGVVGYTFTGTVTNCVALNPSITATDSSPKVGRVVGEITGSGSASGCSAFAGMTVNGAAVNGGAANNENGADIADLATLDNLFTAADGWSAFTAETLPTFKSAEATSTLARPAHLLATPFKGTGTQADPYQISTADQLRHLGTLVNGGDTAYNAEGKYFKLTADLDISGSEWTPIGTSNNGNTFKSNFDGDGHTITGLTINQPTMSDVGLFGYANGTIQTIQNLGVLNVSVVGYYKVGGVVGYSSGVVSNCYSTGSITGTTWVGGVVGLADGAVSNCYSTSTVTGNTHVGGVVGLANGAVSNCYSTGSVTGTDYVGGVAGSTSGAVSNCYSTGSVTSSGYVGGVVGSTSSTVSNCVALNPSITGTGIKAGRVVGEISGFGRVSGGYAYAGMTVNGAAVTGGAANNTNGADATKASFKTANWWKTTAAFPDASWVLANNNLPALKTTGGTLIAGQKTDLPVFLTELPPPPPDPDLAIVEAAKAAAEGAAYTATTQADCTDENAAKAYVENIAKAAVNNNAVTVAATNATYTAPTAGTAANPSGTNGSYKFTVTVSKGLQSETTAEITLTITATAFTGITDVQAVAAAKAAVVDSSVNVAFGADQDAKTAAVQTYVNGLLTGNAAGVTATVKYNSSSGKYDVALKKGSVTDSKTITMTVTENPDPDIAIVEAAKAAAEGATYTATTQADCTDENTAKAYVENIVKTAVNNNDVTVAVNKVSYTAPTAGTAANPSGTNGSYKFTVTVSKGLQSETTAEITLTITATAFTGITDVQAVAAAKAAVVGGSVDVAFGADQDAKTAAVQSYVNGLLTGNAAGVTATVTHTRDNSYLVEFSKGSVSDSKTITMTVNVAPDPDIAIVEAAKTAAEGATYTATTQADCTDENTAKAYVENIAKAAVNNNGVTVAVNKVSYTTPTAGTAADPDGTNGSYKFTVTVSKGTQSETTAEITLTITATPYTSPTHKPVSSITGIPTTATANVPLLLTGTVNPADATNKTIVWSVKSAGTTGATITGSTLNTTAAGSVVVTATIVNGTGATTDYTQDVTITVSAAPTTDVEKIAAVKAAIEAVLSNLTVSNATTAQDILDAANGAASNGVTVAWDSANGFTKTDATADATGSITGTLTLTLNSQAATVAVSKAIPKLTAATYTVTLDANGGSVSPTSLSVVAGDTAALPTPTRSGNYRFDGWFTATGGGTQYTSATPISSSVTLYAHWTYTGGGSGGDSGSSSVGGIADGVTTPGKTVIDNPVGTQGSTNALAEAVKNALAIGKTSQTVYTNFANYTALTKEGIKAINDAAAAAVKGKAVTLNTRVQLDNKAGGAVVSRITVDLTKLAAVMPDKLGLGIWFDQKKDSPVTAVRNKFEKAFDNSMVIVTFEQKTPLKSDMEFAAKPDMTGLNTKSLYFYSYNPQTNLYYRILYPNYWVDKGGYTHFTAPFGGSVVITDKPLTKK